MPEIALSSTIVLVPPGFPSGAAADSGDALLTAPLSRLPALVDTRSSDHGLKNNRYERLFCAYAYPALYSEVTRIR